MGEVLLLLLLLLLLENTVGLVCCTPMVAESDPVQDKLWHVYCSSCIPHSFPTPFKHVTVWTPHPTPVLSSWSLFGNTPTVKYFVSVAHLRKQQCS